MRSEGSRANTGVVPRGAAIAIIACVLGASALIGRRNAPSRSNPEIRSWYRRLRKPDYTPPAPIFGMVWPMLETGLAVGGYRLMREPATPARNGAIALWLVNGAMIGGWTELFFHRRALAASAAVSGAMVATTAGYVAAASRVDRVAAGAGVPLLAWLGFATLLAERVWERNGAGRSTL
jgi:tryptophan-rich sensory protein